MKTKIFFLIFKTYLKTINKLAIPQFYVLKLQRNIKGKMAEWSKA